MLKFLRILSGAAIAAVVSIVPAVSGNVATTVAAQELPTVTEWAVPMAVELSDFTDELELGATPVIAGTNSDICGTAAIDSNGVVNCAKRKQITVIPYTSHSIFLPIDDGEVVGGNTGVSDVAVSQSHACLIKEGVVYCWGKNTFGQLGDGSTDDSLTSPVKVADGPATGQFSGFTNSNVVGVSVIGTFSGYAMTCVVRDEGTLSDSSDDVVYCWGKPGYATSAVNPLGLGSTLLEASLPQKVQDSNSFTNSGVTAVAIGGSATCFVNQGVVSCTGGGYQNGQVGTGNVTPEAIPANLPFNNTAVSQIQAGGYHFCVVESAVVYCWGNNAQGGLGVPSETVSSQSAVAVKTSDVTGGFTNASVTQLAIGDGFSCAVASGSVFCWGQGRFGDGSDPTHQTGSFSAIKVADSGDFVNENVLAVTADSARGCASTAVSGTNRLFCWGDGMSGGSGLGDGGYANASTPQLALVPAELSLTYDPNGAAESASTTTVRVFNEFTLDFPTFTFEGKEIAGWYDSADPDCAATDYSRYETGNQYSYTLQIYADLTLYPKWQDAGATDECNSGGGGGGGGGGNYTPPPPVSPAPTFSVGQSNGALVVCVAMNDSPATFLSASILSTQAGQPSNGDLLSSTYTQRTLTGIADAADAYPRAEEWDGADLAIVFDQHRMLVWNDDYQSEDEVVYEFQDWQVGTEYRVSLYASQVENSFFEPPIAESMLDPVTYTFTATDTDCGVEPPAGTGSSDSSGSDTSSTVPGSSSGVPSLVTSSNQELLSASAGSAKILIDGELVEVELVQASEELRRTVGGARTFAQVRALQTLAEDMVAAVQAVLGEGATLPITVTNTSTGATISGLVTDPVTGDVLPVPVEDVLLILNENLVLMVGGADGANNPANIAFDGVLEFGEGGYVAVLAYGLTPGAAGEVVVMSTPQLLDTFTVGTDGGVAAQAAIPADLAPGEHTVVVAVDGQSASLGFRVLSAGVLPVTGGSSSLPSALAVLLAAAGAFGVLVVSRRRHTA